MTRTESTSAPLPRRVACDWDLSGFYVVSVEGAARAFIDPADCARELDRIVDPRLVLPRGSC